MKANQNVSKEFTTSEEITAKGIVVKAKYAGKLADAELIIKVDAISLLKGLAERTDNKIDNALVAMIAGALK